MVEDSSSNDSPRIEEERLSCLKDVMRPPALDAGYRVPRGYQTFLESAIPRGFDRLGSKRAIFWRDLSTDSHP